MSGKDDSLYVEHMLDCIDRVEEYTAEGKEHFYHSRQAQDAVVRNLQVMAESSQRLSEELKAEHDAIPWRDISGFRNVLVHDYLGLDLEVIWSVVEQDLPVIRAVLEKM